MALQVVPFAAAVEAGVVEIRQKDPGLAVCFALPVTVVLGLGSCLPWGSGIPCPCCLAGVQALLGVVGDA